MIITITLIDVRRIENKLFYLVLTNASSCRLRTRSNIHSFGNAVFDVADAGIDSDWSNIRPRRVKKSSHVFLRNPKNNFLLFSFRLNRFSFFLYRPLWSPSAENISVTICSRSLVWLRSVYTRCPSLKILKLFCGDSPRQRNASFSRAKLLEIHV